MRIFKPIVKTCFMALLVTSLFFACKKKKNSEPVPNGAETEEVAVDSTIYQVKIKATKVITTPLSPALGTQNKMCFGNNKIYAFSRNTEKFMSYDIATNTWKNLEYTDQLAYTGYGGQMIYTPNHAIYYFHGVREIYYTPDYSDVGKKGKWSPSIFLAEAYRTGESGYAFYNDDIYSIGGRTSLANKSADIRKYNTVSEEWTKLASLPKVLDLAKVLVHDKKMYIIGSSSPGIKPDNYGFIYDISDLTTISFPIPKAFEWVLYDKYQFAAYKDYLFLSNGETFSNEFFVYNTKTQKWNKWPVLIEGDFLSGSVNLFVAEYGRFYAAGVKNGNFALYELQVTFPEKELE